MTDDIKAIRDALAAGPTPGPWQDDADGVHRVHAGRHRVILSINISDAQRETDAAYVAAVHPERIARLLDALEQASKDAARYRWLRTFRVDSYRAGGMLNQLDAEIDAAMSDAPGA